MSNEEIASRLQAVIARHLGAPGTIHELHALTGGASRSTWLFDAEAGGVRHRLIMQAGGVWADKATGLVPQLEPEQDARLMIAASEIGVPAPKVRVILEPSDGLGRGYVTERVEGETLGPRIVREAKFADARAVMAGQCGEILATIHRVDAARLPLGGFGSREDLYAGYERVSGTPIDREQVRFWEAFGNLKWVIHCLRLGMRGVAENGIERCAIGRRIEEPLWDFLNLIEGRE